MKLLMTAFEPFGGESINPSAAALEHIGEIYGDKVSTLLLPVSFEKAPKSVCDAIDEHFPDAVIMFGQAGGRNAFTIEHVAINYANARIPDNDGALPRDIALIDDAPAAYFTTLPDMEMVDLLEKNEFPCKQSLSAGAYVCNAVFFNVMHHISLCSKDIAAGFIHVPYCTEQLEGKAEGTFALEQEKINRAAELIADLMIERKNQHK